MIKDLSTLKLVKFIGNGTQLFSDQTVHTKLTTAHFIIKKILIDVERGNIQYKNLDVGGSSDNVLISLHANVFQEFILVPKDLVSIGDAN